MRYRRLGKTDWEVSCIGFGAWGIGGQWGAVETDTAMETIRTAHQAGMNFFDTADAYGEPPGLSEELLGRVLKPVRDEVYIATKVGNYAKRAGHALPYTHPLHVTLCCDASLHRLNTDRIDLYQCHIGNLQEPDVFLEAFETLKAKGKIRACGISTDDVEVLRRFNREGSCATVQLDYSYLNRKAEQELLPYCRENDLGTIVRGPLARGLASGKYERDAQFHDSVRKNWNEGEGRETFLRHLDTVEKVRQCHPDGLDLSQTALRFVISHPDVTTAIPGAKNPEQARANAMAAAEMLDPDLLEKIKEVTGSAGR